MAYTPNEWGVGNLITASKMNKIERQLVANTSDLDDIRNGVTVPTYDEFETLRDDVAAEYDNTKTYAVGDYVIYNTQLYKCKTAITSAETWTVAHWDAVEVGEELQRIEGKNEKEVAELKSAINMIETPQIVGMVNTGNSSMSSNLFQYAAMIGYHKMIYNISNGRVVLTDATSSNTYLIPVDGVSTYTFTFCRSAVVVSDTALSAVGSLLTNVTSVNSIGGKYIVFTFNTSSYSESTYSITKPVNIYKLPANWDLSDITISTPQIDGMLPTGHVVTSYNIFSQATLVATGKYVAGISGTTGKVYLSDSSTGALDTYILPVDGESIYTFTHIRSACLISDLAYTPVWNDIVTNVTTIDSTGGVYILFSFNHNTYPESSYEITKPVPSYYMPRIWVNESASTKDQTDKTSGAIDSNGTITIAGRTALKDGQMIAFKGKFSSFSGFTLNFYGSAVTNYITVTETTIAIKNTTTTPTPVNHGLTIENEVVLTVEFIEGNARISLFSMGDVYTQTVVWNQTNGTVTQPQIASNGTEFSNATLVTSYDCAERKIWIFGDSYLGVTNSARWPYYLKENGYIKNALLNGSAGATSSGATTSFSALIKYGTPAYAVLATGMNDGSDGDNPPSLWTQKRDEFLTLCNDNNIIPIFATVPTVPSVNNERKNAWVRSSGYRYIDFAAAVGADGTGAWYSGMLSSDNVHPSEKGAKALYTQVLIDLPEVTV